MEVRRTESEFSRKSATESATQIATQTATQIATESVLIKRGEDNTPPAAGNDQLQPSCGQMARPTGLETARFELVNRGASPATGVQSAPSSPSSSSSRAFLTRTANCAAKGAKP